MDPFATVISLLRPRAFILKNAVGEGSWSASLPDIDNPSFCLVLAGSCWLRACGQEPVQLKTGDFVLMTGVIGLVLESEAGLASLAVEPNPQEARAIDYAFGQRGAERRSRLVGGHFGVDNANPAMIDDLLPRFVHVRASDIDALRFASIVRLIDDEAREDRPGRDLILQRLVEVLLVEALRWESERSVPRPAGILAGLADAKLAEALKKIHGDAGRSWTVAELGRCVGMSRSVFAERFTRIVGTSPCAYIIRWRMALAKDALRNAGGTLSEIAAATGYASTAAFSSAFVKHVGLPPSAFARGQ